MKKTLANCWHEHEAFILESKGNLTAIEIATEIGVTERNLRWHCAKRHISLRSDRAREGQHRRAKMKREAARLEKGIVDQDTKTSLNIDIESLWKIPKRCFHQAHMGNFT